MNFWSDPIIERCGKVLQWLKSKYDFVLIGGWAIYLHTKAIKSKDIDIVADYATLEKLVVELPLKKNERLRKYEASAQGVAIDIYVPFFSKLVVPPEDLIKNTTTIQGFKVPKPEQLLILKQQAELERKHSIKGLKDRVDILCIFLHGDINVKLYKELLERYEVKEFRSRLKTIIRSAKDEFAYLGIKDLREIKKIKRKIIDKL